MGEAATVQHVNTDKMNDERIAYDNAMEKYRENKDSLKTLVDNLLEHWEGDGRKEFAYDYNLLSRQLEDLLEVLLDLRKGLVKAEESFISADAEVSKQIAVATAE